MAQPRPEAITGEEFTPLYPWVFVIESDPKELWNLGSTMPCFIKYQKKTKGYPNISPGAPGPVIRNYLSGNRSVAKAINGHLRNNETEAHR
jgi:hypothetical protein